MNRWGRRVRNSAVGLVGAVALAAALSACSSPSTNSSGSPPTTAPSTSASLPAITKAVEAYQSSQGISPSRYRVVSVAVSTVYPSWAKFVIGPTASDAASFQGGYGFVHQTAVTWRVTGFGSAQVGCPLTGSTTPAAVTYVTVPANVLSAFGLPCPPNTSPTATSAAPTTTTTIVAKTKAAIVGAITKFQRSQGMKPAQWTIGSILVSTKDPTWAKFTVNATPDSQGTFQPGYGFAHRSGPTWSVTGFGTSDVGCPPGTSDNLVVPTNVMASFAMVCPPPVS